MVFAYTLDKKIPMRDGHGSVGPLYTAIGTYTNVGGDTGGEIDTEGDLVLYADTTNNTAAKANIVTINDASNGLITIVCADGDDGQWSAIVQGYA